MTQALLGDRVWDDLRPWLAGHTHLDAAIGYVGSTAGKVLTPAPGSRVIVDGSAAALTQGMTAPAVLRRWVRSGVHVASLAGLHAKCMVISPAAGDKVAVIGSANASQHSAYQLRELSVLLDSEGLVEVVEDQLDVWWALADQVDPDWLTRADKLYQRPRSSGPRRRDRTSLINPKAPLWLGEWVDRPVTLSRTQEAALRDAWARNGTHVVTSWILRHGDEHKIKAGHTVVQFLVRESGQPHGNTRADAPSTVTKVLPGKGKFPPVAILVRPPGLPQRRTSEIARAVGLKPTELPVEAPITDQAQKDAIFALWP